MKLSDMTGHVLTIGLAGMIACSHAQPAPDASAKQDETKQEPQPEAKPSAEEYHAQGQADLDKALEQLRGVSVFFEFDSATRNQPSPKKDPSFADGFATSRERMAPSNLASRSQRKARSRSSQTITISHSRSQSCRRIVCWRFGAEKPKALGHDEEAWRQNRRDDLTAKR